MNKQQEKLEKFVLLADEYCGLLLYNAETAKELSNILQNQNSINLKERGAGNEILTNYPRTRALASAINDYIIEILKITTQLTAEIEAVDMGASSDTKDNLADAEPTTAESEGMQS